MEYHIKFCMSYSFECPDWRMKDFLMVIYLYGHLLRDGLQWKYLNLLTFTVEKLLNFIGLKEYFVVDSHLEYHYLP